MRRGVKRAVKTAGDVPVPKKKKPRAYKMPDPLPVGEILTDMTKQQWSLGASVGKGGFGEIYLASETKKSKASETNVIKIEPHENGPLFCELHFYQRGGKSNLINDWKKEHKLQHLGVPAYIASGQHEHGNTKYRFLVMERFGEDLSNLFVKVGLQFSPKTAYTIAIQIVESLEYLHSTGYAHADIKGGNLLLGYGKKAKDQVFLVDYGLASRYMPNNEHREYKEEPKKAHDGTLEYTSRDAHNGVYPARRSDLEILGYVLIQWLAGKLPWEKCLDEVQVQKQKEKYMKDPDSFLKVCFEKKPPFAAELKEYLKYVSQLKYEEAPKYAKIKDIFKKSIVASGSKYDGKLVFENQKATKATVSPKKRAPRQSPEKKSKAKAQTPKQESSNGQRKRKSPRVLINGMANRSCDSETSPEPVRKNLKRTTKTAKTGTSSSDITSSPEPVRKKKTTKRGTSSSDISSPEPAKKRTNKTDQRGTNSSVIESSKKGIPIRRSKRTVGGAKQVSIAVQTSPGLKGLRAKRGKVVKVKKPR